MIFGVALCDNGFMHHGKCMRSAQAALAFSLMRCAQLEGSAGAGRGGTGGRKGFRWTAGETCATICCCVYTVSSAGLKTIPCVAQTEGLGLARVWLGGFISCFEIDP